MLGTLITASLVSLALQVPLAAAGPLSLVKRDDAADKAWDNAVEDKALWATHQDAEIKLKRPDTDEAFKMKDDRGLEWHEPEWPEPTKADGTEGCNKCDRENFFKWTTEAPAKSSDEKRDWPKVVGKLDICVCTTPKTVVDWKAKDKFGLLLAKLNRLPTAIRKDLKIINVHDALSFEPTIYEIEGKDHFFEASLNVWMDELKLFDAKTAEIKDGDKTIKVEPFLDEFKKIISSQKPSYNQCLPSPEALKSHRTALKQILGYYFSYWQQMEPPPKTGIDTNNHGRRMTWNRLNLGCMFPAIRGVIEHIREKRGGRGLPLPGLANMVPFRMHVTEYYRHNGKKFQTSGSGPVPETMLDVISLPCPASNGNGLSLVVERHSSCPEGVKSKPKIDTIGTRSGGAATNDLSALDKNFSDILKSRRENWCESKKNPKYSFGDHTGSSVPVLDMTDEKKSSIIVMYGNKLKGKGVDILFETEPISAYRFEVCRPNK
ncbi:hypothetical protein CAUPRSCDRAFT_10525 [Caulochytrium protostelioides]|uniref:Uncharacterized protein n=1 Tax=Caulochytrium protostelioides TaxID=1555241 RepID=A0A4P9WZP7_9FUNG|nr:hypothetical protein CAUPRSCDRAFT_10525 [Caulochytrium protostelioides]